MYWCVKVEFILKKYSFISINTFTNVSPFTYFSFPLLYRRGTFTNLAFVPILFLKNVWFDMYTIFILMNKICLD